MNSENDKNVHYENEINLYQLWVIIIKRKKLIFGIFIVSVISAMLISLTSPKVYRGEAGMRIQVKEFIPTRDSISTKELMSTKELFEIIGNLDQERIKTIFPQYSDFINNVKIRQIPGSTDKFKITIEIMQITHFQDIMKTFAGYLNNIPSIKKAVEQGREQLIKRLEEIDIVMAKSQQDADKFQKMMVKEKLNPIGFNPVQFNRMLSELEIEKIVLQQAIKNNVGVEIISQPTISLKPVKPKPVLYIIFAGIISLIAGLFLVGFLNYWKRIKG